MTANAIEHAPQETDNPPGRTLSHYYCCSEDLALCGTDISGYVDSSPQDAIVELCIVCREVTVCGRCGADLT